MTASLVDVPGWLLGAAALAGLLSLPAASWQRPAGPARWPTSTSGPVLLRSKRPLLGGPVPFTAPAVLAGGAAVVELKRGQGRPVRTQPSTS